MYVYVCVCMYNMYVLVRLSTTIYNILTVGGEAPAKAPLVFLGEVSQNMDILF